MNAHVRSSILHVTSSTSVPALACPRDTEALWSYDLVVFLTLVSSVKDTEGELLISLSGELMVEMARMNLSIVQCHGVGWKAHRLSSPWRRNRERIAHGGFHGWQVKQLACHARLVRRTFSEPAGMVDLIPVLQAREVGTAQSDSIYIFGLLLFTVRTVMCAVRLPVCL